MDVGKRIKIARKNAKMTQKELANKVGKGMSTVQKYELGLFEPSIQILQEIAAVLEVDINWLMRGQTLEERDTALKDKVTERFEDAEKELKRVTDNIVEKTQKLNYGGRSRLSDYADDLYSIDSYRTNKDE